MASLTPGTPVEGSTDPRTLEQNQSIATIQSPDTSAIQPKYGGFLMTPDGKLTNDLSILNIPEARRAEIELVLANKNAVMMLNENGVPVQFYPTGIAREEPDPPPPTPAPIPPAMEPVQPVKTIDAGDVIRISKNQFKKTYVQDSMATLESDSFSFENVSSGFIVTISIDQLPTYHTDVTTFDLQPKEKREVKIIYDTPDINTLPEGTVKIYPSIKYTTKAVYQEPPPNPPVVIIPKVDAPPVIIAKNNPEPEVIPEPQPNLPTIEPSPPIYIEPRVVPYGRWVLTKISDEQVNTEKIITFVAEENGQLPNERNNWTAGRYRTVYGKTKTTIIPAQYDYLLEGDMNGAGPKPSVNNAEPSVTISEQDILENTLLYQVASDIVETNNIAKQTQQTPQVLVEQTSTVDTPRETVQISSSGGGSGAGGFVINDQQSEEQVSFYRKLSQLEFAE